VGFFLETDDFARDHAAMRAAGVIFEEVARDESYGRVAVWRDPFGNRWDLIEPR
jgi:catechol 2,3-dioxygenase-like lactoylglutathione lyase family enzyme